MGVYLFNAKALQKVLEGSDIDFGREVIPHSIRRFKSFGYVFHGYWKDIGTIKSFYVTNIELASHKPHFAFFYEGVVFSRPRFLPPARIVNCRISNSLVAEGCVITDAEIESSVVGLRTILGKGSKITRTVIMGADYYEDPHKRGLPKLGIGDNTVIHGAIVDKNARIGRNVVIKNLKGLNNFDGPNYFIRDGIVIVPKNGRVEDGTKI
jgi:glucose-1-phosphate adenylyltransferase